MKNKYLQTLLSAILTALPFTIPSLAPISLVAPSVFFYHLLKADDKRDIRRLSFLWSIVYYLGVHYYFVALYPLDFAGLSRLASLGVVLIGWVGISLLQGSELAVTFIIFKRLFSKNTVFTPIALAIFFSLCEWVQTLGWLGFPWGQLALTQHAFLPFIQSLSLFGPYFLSFLIALINGILALFCLNKRKKTLIIALAIFVVNTCFGAIRLSIDSDVLSELDVALVQPSLMSGDKWDSSNGQNAFDVHMRMSDEVKDADLILWSETAIPSELLDNSYRMDKINSFIEENQCDLIAGAFDTRGGKTFNTAIYLSSDKPQCYYKQRLVPFGEYVPMRSFIEAILPFMTDINMLSSDLTAGDKSMVFETRYGKIGALVCFDSIFSSLARKSSRDGAELIAIITNDSWYKTSTALTHHNAQAVFRSVENNRYVVRCANSGISSVVDARGRVISSTEPLEQTVLSETVSLIGEKTLYTLTGNIFTPISFFVLVGYYVIQKKKTPVR